MILALRTDNPRAELYLMDRTGATFDARNWQADRKLADELLPHLQSFLENNKLTFVDLEGIIVFTGSGSFTGLRIGSAVANAIAYGCKIAVVATEGANWLQDGVHDLIHAKPSQPIIPRYDSEPNITKPKPKIQ